MTPILLLVETRKYLYLLMIWLPKFTFPAKIIWPYFFFFFATESVWNVKMNCHIIQELCVWSEMNNVESKSRKSNIKKDKVKCSLSPAHMAIKHLLDSIDFSSAVSARESVKWWGKKRLKTLWWRLFKNKWKEGQGRGNLFTNSGCQLDEKQNVSLEI